MERSPLAGARSYQKDWHRDTLAAAKPGFPGFLAFEFTTSGFLVSCFRPMNVADISA
jgi:hypothetical protein